MSASSVDSPVAEVTATLADYQDLSGEFQTPLSRTNSIATQVAPEELAQQPSTLSATQEEVETEDEDEDEEQEQQEQEQQQKQQKERDNYDYDAAVGFASIILLGGAVLGGLALYMNQPVSIEHPMTRGDYF